MQRVLGDIQCQLKIVWSQLDGSDYDPGHPPTAWSQARAQGITDWYMPKRHVLLGVDIEDRHSTAIIRALRATTEWLHDDDRAIPERELVALDDIMRRLAAQLSQTPWNIRPASVEMLSWMLARENHRTAQPIPRDGTLTGTSVARLMRGRALPWPDHMRFYGPEGHEQAFTCWLTLTQFPEEMIVPGNGTWLLTLSGIDRAGLPGEPDRVPILATGDVRFEFLTQPKALAIVNKVRKSAKEQRREAEQSSAEETDDDVAMSEQEMRTLGAEIRRGRTQLVRASILISVTEDTKESLDASVQALQTHYAGLGIKADILEGEQREAFLQAMPCDQLRLEDLAHVMDAEGFFGSWFWGGSVTGEAEGPVVGHTTGATPLLVRAHPTEAPRRGDTATTAILGRSGRGKTTLMQLMALDAADEGAWVPILDLKGDLDNRHGGIVGCAREHGIPAEAVNVSGKFAGAADLLALSSHETALSEAHSQLMLLVSEALRVRAQPVLMEHISALLESGERRSTARLIQRMAASEEATAQAIAAELSAWRTDTYGAAIVGERGATEPLSTEPGIRLIRFPGMKPPDSSIPASEWTASQRVQAAVIRGFLAWINQIAARQELRNLRKMVCLPEAHLLTATTEGATFLGHIARMGRAQGVCLLIDSQDTASIAENDGIMEQIGTVFAFSQNTHRQQEALATLLGLEPSKANCDAIRDVSVEPGTGEIAHGHCYMRDWRNRVASIQTTYPNSRVADLLDTSPESAMQEDAA